MNKKKLSLIYLSIILMSIILLVINCKKDNNTPPDVPELLSPTNGLIATQLDTLKWKCTDRDGDKLVYDVYFSKYNSQHL